MSERRAAVPDAERDTAERLPDSIKPASCSSGAQRARPELARGVEFEGN